MTSNIVRKLVVEVVDGHDLLPKDGQGTSSPFVVVVFEGQKKKTKTVFKDLNPTWNECLEFIVEDPAGMEAEELQIEVYNDKHTGSGRKNHFLGRIKIYGSQFSKKGEEGLIYFPLEKKSLLSWIRGELGLRIYYYDELEGEQKSDVVSTEKESSMDKTPVVEDENVFLTPSAAAQETQESPPIDIIQDSGRPITATILRTEQPHENLSPEIRKVQVVTGATERVRIVKRTTGEFTPRPITSRFSSETERIAAYDLVEPMQYLFVKIVKARGLSTDHKSYVKILSGSHFRKSKLAISHGEEANLVQNPEWNEVFALTHNRPDSTASTLEISVWDVTDSFIGGVCFDLSDVPVRDSPDSPLAPQWYRLEGGEDQTSATANKITGDIMLSVWIGTQADDAFAESWNSDAPNLTHTRSKVYQSPKLWYLRVTAVEAQDLHMAAPSPVPMYMDVRVKAQLDFQTARTRRASTRNHNNSSYFWQEDLIFVAREPLDDQLKIVVEDSSTKEPSIFGTTTIPLSSIEQRLDERPVANKWFSLDDESYHGRILLRICLEGGYHVLDEAAHVCSDFRPTAKQLWKPAVGVLELGILGAKGLLPMKTKGGGKGTTDAYCIAKYGKKWVRTRTIKDSFDPRWNEQYTWQVYDPCTVLTIGVFDNWRMFTVDANGEEKTDFRIGKVRIRISTLENNKVYTNSYPLLVLSRTGVKKMGEIELAVRFACPSMLPDTCAIYGQPMLPRMHYVRPLGLAQQETLRGVATKMVAAWFTRAEPPLGQEVVRYMLDADSHAWSMRKSKANWFRIINVIAWAVSLAKWVHDIRRWRNPVTTVLVHLLYLVLVWYPELVAPTAFLYIFLIGAWYYKFRPRVPPGMDVRLSQAEMVDSDELDEEFDLCPTGKPPDILRLRYDRLRALAGRIQTVLGDIATQGERLQALVSWRDPRATRIFILGCLGVAIVLYVVPAKMVSVALGFYFLRHPMFRDSMPPTGLNFFRRLPSLSDRLL